MKNILATINLVILIFLININGLFLLATAQDEDLSQFYFQGQELSLDYLPIEKLHMADVKDLSLMALIINLISLIIFVTTYKFVKINLKIVGFSLLGLVIFFAIMAIFFETFFDKWHTVFFQNDNWLLPPQAKLIQDYPLSYFKEKFIFLNIMLAFWSILMLSLNKYNKIK